MQLDGASALHGLSDAVSTVSSVVSAAFVLRDVVTKLSDLLAAVEEDDDESEESSVSDVPGWDESEAAARPTSPGPSPKE